MIFFSIKMELPHELPQRFWDKVDKSSACWLWTGAAQEGGRVGSEYKQGRFKIEGKSYLVHKLSLEAHLGRKLGAGMITRHICTNSLCVNPKHLQEGTQKENCVDMIRDGTSTRGVKHHKNKLTPEQVREIRASTESCPDLGRKYGVHYSNISHIKSGKSWAWLK